MASNSEENNLTKVDNASVEPILEVAKKFLEKAEENMNSGEFEKAFVNGTKALGLSEGYWQAHHLLARYHRKKNQFKKAIFHCQTALALSPNETQVKNELEVCKTLASWWEQDETSDPSSSFTDALEYVEASAASSVSQSADVGKAEGLFHLGICHRQGKGVKQDLKKAFEFYLKAAHLPAAIPGTRKRSNKKNIAVVYAQIFVALFYEYGEGVEHDYSKAMEWYKKATDNRSGIAAYYLGLMYENAKGVPRNFKIAHKYWKQAIDFGEPNKVAEYFVLFYIHNWELEPARITFEAGRHLRGSVLAGITEEEFSAALQPVLLHHQEYERAVLLYEKDNNLSMKDKTFLERVHRYMKYQDEQMKTIFKNFGLGTDSNQSTGGPAKPSKNPNDPKLEPLANAGSSSADLMVKEPFAFLRLYDFIEKNEVFNDEEKATVLNQLYECLTLQLSSSSDLDFPGEWQRKFKVIIAHLFQSCEDGKTSEVDMKIRLCYGYFNRLFPDDSSNTTLEEEMMEVLKQGNRLYPENVHFYQALSLLYSKDDDPNNGLIVSKKGLEKFEEDLQLLLLKAIHLQNQPGADFKETVTAFETFLKKAPADYPSVLDAYYCLANLYAREPSDALKVEHYYKLGQEAETNMTVIKRKVERLHKVHKADETSAGPSSATGPLALNPGGISILEQKDYLRSPSRKELILEHRDYIFQLQKQKRFPNLEFAVPNTLTVKPPTLLQTFRREFFIVTKITLSEMKPVPDTIGRYENRKITLTVVEDPWVDLNFKTAFLLVEDETGELTRAQLSNLALEDEKEAEEKLGFGCKIGIINPCVWIRATDGKSTIINDQPRSLAYLGKAKNMCRFCGEVNVTKACAKCLQAKYCSKECQILDWKLLKHKLICSAPLDC